MSGRRQDFEAWQRGQWEETFGRERPTALATNLAGSGTRVIVLLTFDTQGDVDAAVPGYQLGPLYPNGKINYVDLTQRQYGVRRGVQRILGLLREFGAKGTFPTCGATAEWYPDVVSSILEEGHEVAAHGYRHVPLYELTEEEERAEIEAATTALERVAGERPKGWRSPMYSTTSHTIRILAENGYSYNTDFHNDDLPYYLDGESYKMLEIPAGLDDWSLFLMNSPYSVNMGGTPYGTASSVFDVLRAQFDTTYRESEAGTVGVFQVCMHPKITGVPYRAEALYKLLEHVGSRPGVEFLTMSELASACSAEYGSGA